MRNARTLAILCLGALIGALVAYLLFLWCRGPQPVTRIDPIGNAMPLLRSGQVLEWRGTENGVGFSIVWLTPSPCEDNRSSLQSQMVGKVPTVKCKVMKDIPHGSMFQYGIGPLVPPPGGFIKGDGGGGTNPCYGCSSWTDGGESGQSDDLRLPFGVTPGLLTIKDSVPPGIVNVSCSEAPGPAAVKVSPDPVTAVSLSPGAGVEWFHASDVSLPTQPKFNNAPNAKCTAGAGYWTCTFPADQVYTNPALTYSIAATGTGSANCGTSSGSGTINSPTP
jgi:hypothetical protein